MTIRFRHLLLPGLILGLLISALPTSIVGAANQNAGQALEIAPPVLNLKADPGQTITTKIILRDVSTSKLVVRNQINDFVANDKEDGTPRLLLDDSGEESPYSLKSWIQPLPEFTLNPKQINELPVKIKVPANAAPGGYYAVVRFTATPPNLDGTGVSLSASLGTLVLLRINGDAKESMKVEQFTTTKNDKETHLFESQPITFLARIKNEGSTHEQPTGAIVMSDMFGNKVAGISVNQTRGNILPGSIRKFEQTIDSSTIGNRFLFGRYTADIKLDYGTKGETITASTSFWVIPYRLVGFSILLIIILIIVGRIAISRYNERLISRSRSRRRRR
jgi:hypothetical protein